ncbi:MAG: hypothetical protein WC702_04580 [Patescibacteria group bacterium]|jgi:hypothetical protein
MTHKTSGSAETESIESWFFQSAVRTNDCSMEQVPGKELCPGYYKTLASAADWHVVTAGLAVIIVCLFIGLVLEKRDY